MIKRTLIFLDRLHWVWLALASPFLLFPSPKRSLAMLVVPALFLLRWLALKAKQPELPQKTQTKIYHRTSVIPYTPLNGALLLMLLMVLISLWATYDISESLPKVSGMVLGMGIFFAMVREGEHPRSWTLSLLVFLGIGSAIALLGLFGSNWISSNKIALFGEIIAHLPRLIKGLQGAESGFHPNEVAGGLLWVLPVIMAVSVALFFIPRLSPNKHVRALRNDWQKKIGGWRLIGVIILCLLTTFFIAVVFLLCQSRSGYIGLIITLPVLVLLALPARWRWYSLVVLALIAIVLGILIALHWEAVRVWISGSDLAADPAFALNSLNGRMEVWSRAIYGIQDFPFTGMGMNTFRKVVSVVYPMFNLSPEIDIGHAHNEFLQSALDLGIPGLIALLGLYIGAFWMLADVWKATSHPLVTAVHWSLIIRLLALGMGGGLLAHLLYGMTDAVALGAKPGILFWMLLGLVTALHQQTQKNWTDVGSTVSSTGTEIGSEHD